MTLHFTVFGAIQGEKADEVANNTPEGGCGGEERSAQLHQLPSPAEKIFSQAWPISLLYWSISFQKDLSKEGTKYIPQVSVIIYTQR